MRKVLTVALFAVVLGATALAGVVAPRLSATPDRCHSMKPSIKAASSVLARKYLVVTGAEPQIPAHQVVATLQYRRSGTSKWTAGPAADLVTGKYYIKWKAPKKTGKYQIRVMVAYQGEGASASNYTSTRSVAVK